MPPRIETPRLVLTWPTAAQIDGYHAAILGTDMFDTIRWDGPDSPRDLHDFWEGQCAMYGPLEAPLSVALIDRATDRYVGGASLRPVDHEAAVLDLGYALAPEFYGRGLATEAVRALVDHGFAERGAERIFASVFVGNTASRHVAEKVGMRLEGTSRRAILKGGTWLDQWILAITRPDWEDRGAP